MDKKQLIWVILIAILAAMWLPKLLGIEGKEDKPAAPKAPARRVVDEDLGPSRWSFDGTGLTREQVVSQEIPGGSMIGSLKTEDGYPFRLALDPRGAGIRGLRLAGHYDTVSHKRRKDKSDEQLAQWSYSLLNPVMTAGRPVLPFSTQKIRIEGEPDVPTFISPTTTITSADAQGGTFQGHLAWKLDPNSIVRDEGGIPYQTSFILELYPDAKAIIPQYRFTKTYKLTKGSNSLRVELKLENLTESTQKLSVVQYGPAGVPRENLRNDMRSVPVGRHIVEEKKIEADKVLDIGKIAKLARDKAEPLGTNTVADKPVVWAASVNKFFGCMMYPLPKGLDPAAVDAQTPAEDLTVPAKQREFSFDCAVVEGRLGSQLDALADRIEQIEQEHAADPAARDKAVAEAREQVVDTKTPLVVFTSEPEAVAAGQSLTLAFDVYCGVKSRDTFENIPLYKKLAYTGTIRFRECFCVINWLVLGLMWIIEAGGGLLGNYGIVIIVLVLLIRALLHPITKKSQVNMMKFQKLQPQIKEIQAKYKDDKAGQQKAMMEFMKGHGASPILGCLPMLLQMPIWIALYTGLQASASLRHEGLLPFWITDLAGTDAILTFKPVMVPLLGGMIGPVTGLNILPLLMTAFMFLQQKFTPMQSQATASEDQRKQQKMMMVMMSAMMMLFFYNAPSGLTLYVMASSAGGVLESYFIRKHIREREALDAARETRVSVPGTKVARGQRPKKPKGPFKY